MSQQELMPEPQSSQLSQESYEAQSQDRQPLSGTRINAQPYSWPRQPRDNNLPKSDHPSTFEDSLPPYSYPAQDQAMSTQQPNSKQNVQWQQQVQTADINTSRSTFKGAYQSYSQYKVQYQAPWWARAQEKPMDTSRWIGLLVLVVILMVGIPMLCSIGTVLASVLFAFSLLPVILALAPVVLFLVFSVLSPENHNNRRHRRHHRSRYDQSWWW
jgi:hypothetical protein